MKKYIIIGIVIVVLAVGYYALSPLFIHHVANDASPLVSPQPSEQSTTTTTSTTTTATVIEQGIFKPQVHNVSGNALVIDTSAGKVLRMENFNTLNGPNLHVYLSKDLTAKDVVDLGPLKATSGNVNYDIPAGTDTTAYAHVLIWCVDFKVLFGSADLS